MKRLNSRGDTIVEVLLALVVVSSVLAGAYVTSNHSLSNSRQAQERGEALKYVEGQIEQIKARTPAAASAATPFCFNKDSSGAVAAAGSAGCAPGNNPVVYNLSITRPAVGTYSIAANWDNAIGTGQDQITMYYRVDQ